MNKIFKTAFTLIELLVVIAIIGILSGLIIIGMSGMTQSANIAKAQVFSNSLRNSLMSNLIAEYKLDDNGNDTWGGHASGTISGVVSQSSCMQNTCYSFDAVDDYIELPDSSDLRLTTGGTISAWIYPESAGESGNGRIIDKSIDTNGTDGYLFYLSANNTIRFLLNAGTTLASLTNVIAFNQWQLATVTFDSSGRKIYVNGVNKTSTGGAETALPPNVSGVIRIGQRAGATDRTFDGYVDEVRIYNMVIPTSQIKEQYYAGLNSLLINGQIDIEEYSQMINSVAAK